MGIPSIKIPYDWLLDNYGNHWQRHFYGCRVSRELFDDCMLIETYNLSETAERIVKEWIAQIFSQKNTKENEECGRWLEILGEPPS